MKKNIIILILVTSLKLTQPSQEFASKNSSHTITNKNQKIELENNVIELTDDNFEETIGASNKPVIIDFYTQWCGPCKNIKPIFKQIAKEQSENFLFYAVDLEKCPKVAEKYKIKSVPTFFIFKNNVKIGSFTGSKTKLKLLETIEDIIRNSNKATTEIVQKNEIDHQEYIQIYTIFQNKDIESIKELIKKTKDLNTPFSFNGTDTYIMVLAFLSPSKEIINLLIENGAKINNQIINLTKECLENYNIRLSKGIKNLNYLEDKIKSTQFKTEKETNRIIENQSELNIKLFTAITNSEIEEIKVLISKGADINGIIEVGQDYISILGMAIFLTDKEEILDILLQNNLDLNIKMKINKTELTITEQLNKILKDIDLTKELLNNYL